MLYDPKWEKTTETKPEVFSLAGLIAWLEQQPPEAEYDWPDIDGCLLCNYLRAVTGVKRPAAQQWATSKSIGFDTLGKNWGYWQICKVQPRTYGAALARARAVLAAG